MPNLPKNPLKVDLSQLNPAQREAVVSADGPLLVLAGAGTGKTRVVACRVAWLVARGVEPGAILAVTFTNRAAREMKRRIADMIPAAMAEPITVCTFHSFGARLLRLHIGRLGYAPNFDIANDAYVEGVVQSLLTELGLPANNPPTAVWKQCLSKAKASLLTPDEIAADDAGWPPGFERLYPRYIMRMKAMNVLDFDDLLSLVVRLWQEHPEVLEECRRQYRYLMVDEYQDTNHTQFVLTSLLAGAAANLCVVGDDDQSIYGWRGAAVGNILGFQDQFPKAKVVRLEQNYRSSNTILEAANQVIANNPRRHHKALWSRGGQGDKIMIVKAKNENEEAEFAASLVRERKAVRGGSLDQFAVLYRSNHLSRSLEDAFRRAGIDYCVVGAKSFCQRREVIDALSFLRLAANPRDDQSLLRVLNVPPRGIGDRSLGHLLELQRTLGGTLQELMVAGPFPQGLSAAAATAAGEFSRCLQEWRSRLRQPGGLAEKIRGYLREIGYLDGLARIYKPRQDAIRRRENVLELFNAAAELEDRRGSDATLGEFLELFTLRDDNDRVKGRLEGSVALMTVHAAKGLEFPVVIVIGMEHELFPHHNSLKEGGLEEERRLFYVAATRAREELYLTYAARRRVGGNESVRRVSPFVREIPVCHTIDTDVASAFKPASAETAAEYLTKMKEMFGAANN